MLLTTIYSPDDLIIDDDTQLLECPVPDGALEEVHNLVHDGDWQILYALQCQFNSNKEPYYCSRLVRLVFDYMEPTEKKGYLRDLCRSLELCAPIPSTTITRLLNDPEEGRLYLERQSQQRAAKLEIALEKELPAVMVKNLPISI